MRAVMSKTFRNEGMLGFYKGLGPPLSTVPLVNSIVFASYELAKNVMGVQSESEFTFKQSMLAGCFAGFTNSFVVSPIELVKCRLQVQRESAESAYYRGSVHALRRILVEEGVRGVYKGTVATILREVPCYAGQFGSYYVAKRLWAQYTQVSVEDISVMGTFFCGGAGGFFCWLFSYPQDIIKTRLQIARVNQYGKHWSSKLDGGFSECAADIYRKDGMRGFWRGFSACSARAIFANQFLFATYEYAQSFFKN